MIVPGPAANLKTKCASYVIALDGEDARRKISRSPPIRLRMKFPLITAALLAGFSLTFLSGCAVLTKGSKQTVVVRSTPAGATAKINGVEVGETPFRVKLRRDEVFRIDLEKNGFASESAIILPSSSNYDQRFLRWGLDYDLGRATDLIPEELSVELTPALGEFTSADRFEEMSAQIVRADAMLASGELSTADHRYLVSRIVETYHRR